MEVADLTLPIDLTSTMTAIAIVGAEVFAAGIGVTLGFHFVRMLVRSLVRAVRS